MPLNSVKLGDRDRGGVKSPKIRGGGENFEFSGPPFYRDSIENRQFRGQKSKSSRGNFRGEFPPSSVRYVLTPLSQFLKNRAKKKQPRRYIVERIFYNKIKALRWRLLRWRLPMSELLPSLEKPAAEIWVRRTPANASLTIRCGLAKATSSIKHTQASQRIGINNGNMPEKSMISWIGKPY